MSRIIRPLVALLVASLGSQAFACPDITFTFDNNTGARIRVNQVRVFDANTGANSTAATFKECIDTFTCATPAVNLPAVAVGDNITAVWLRYRRWNGAGWSANMWSPAYAPVVPVCVDFRNYGAVPI